MMERAFVGWVLGLLLLGCSAELPPEPEQAPLRDAASHTELARGKVLPELVSCERYAQYGAALATYTLECLGTVAPSSYRVSGGKLERGFESCAFNPSTLRDIDALLSLQEREAKMPGLARCLTGRYAAFLDQFPSDKVSACPTWQKLETVNPVTPAIIDHTTLVLERAFAHPNEAFTLPEALEEKNWWAVSFEEKGEGADAGATAAACAGAFDGFVLGHDADSVLTDPVSWLLSVVFINAAANPFLRPGFFHPMSFAGPPPGAIFAHYNRFAPCPGCPPEACSYYSGGLHFKTRLQADCLDPTDINTCVAFCGPPAP